MNTVTHNINRDEVASLILSSLRDILTGNGSPVDPAQCTAETRLIGKSAVLDSMGLVMLIVDVEQQLEAQHGLVVTLADDRAMSQARSPFASVGSLADYVLTLVGETS